MFFIILGILFVVSTVTFNDLINDNDKISIRDEESEVTTGTNSKAAASWYLTTTELVIDDSGIFPVLCKERKLLCLEAKGRQEKNWY